MIVLSNSVPKSGSTLIANFQEDLLKLTGLKSGQEKLISEYSGNLLNGIRIKCCGIYQKLISYMAQL